VTAPQFSLFAIKSGYSATLTSGVSVGMLGYRLGEAGSLVPDAYNAQQFDQIITDTVPILLSLKLSTDSSGILATFFGVLTIDGLSFTSASAIFTPGDDAGRKVEWSWNTGPFPAFGNGTVHPVRIL
jgi:hypothetical protein